LFEGKVRSIALTEQGFDCSDKENGEEEQCKRRSKSAAGASRKVGSIRNFVCGLGLLGFNSGISELIPKISNQIGWQIG
jgi:hypothetical protein